MSRTLRVGALAAAAYVAVVVATVGLTHRHVRPLFDAVGPAAPYRWVNPPSDFAAGNVKPSPSQLTFGVTATDPPPGGASEDSQFVFSLPRGAIAAKGDAKVVAAMTPRDPDKLGTLPAKTFADGNAYQIAFTYTDGSVAPTTATGSVLLTVPVPADALMYSPDGKTWQTVKSKSASATSIGGDMPGAGYYVATSPNVVSTGGGGGGGAGRLILPIVITALVAAALVATPVVLRRRRPQQGGRAEQRRRQRQRRR